MIYPLIVLVSFFASWSLTRWAIRLSDRYGAFEMPAPRKIHDIKVPNLGWVGIFGAWSMALGAIGLVAIMALLMGEAHDPYIAGMMRKAPKMAGIALGGLLSIFFGWQDDCRKMGPFAKLLVQLGLAFLLCALGVRITLFSAHFLSCPMTVAWILCVMNAFNLLDNFDGSCAGVALIGCALFLCVATWLHQHLICLLLSSFLGALGGFLVFNFPPARIFMGNAGSTFVGYTMSTLTILETFYKKGVPSHLAVIMPVLILAVPIYDMASVIIIRLARKLPVYHGDTNHFSHRLLRLGLTTRQAVAVIYGITLLIGTGCLFLPFVPVSMALLIFAGCALFLLGLGFWEYRRQGNRAT